MYTHVWVRPVCKNKHRCRRLLELHSICGCQHHSPSTRTCACMCRHAHVFTCVRFLRLCQRKHKKNGYASCILIAAANGACPPARLPAGPPACPPANPPARRPAGPPTCPARPARLTACPSTCLPYSQHQSTYSQHTVNIQSTSTLFLRILAREADGCKLLL